MKSPYQIKCMCCGELFNTDSGRKKCNDCKKIGGNKIKDEIEDDLNKMNEVDDSNDDSEETEKW